MSTNPTGKAWLLFGLWGLIVVGYLWLRSTAGFTYPVPWPDEGSFLWQAIAFQEHGTLFAPELNPDRHLMWMPPGYALLTGTVFKLTGFSLAWARALSCVYLLLATTWLATRCRALGPRRALACIAVIGIFLHSRAFLFMSNMARMETLLLLMAVASTALLQARRPSMALALSALAPLVHPNGLFFLGSVLLWLAFAVRREGDARWRLRKTWPALAIAAMAWSGYGLYVAQHWPDFVRDMQYQLSAKGHLVAREGSFVELSLQPSWLVRAALIGVLTRWWRPAWRPVMVTQALPLLFLAVASLGATYLLFSLWLDMLLSIAVLDAGATRLRRSRPAARPTLSVVGLLAVLWADVVLTDTTWGAPQDWEAEIDGDRYAPGLLQPGTAREVPYWTPRDALGVRALLGRLQAEAKPVSVVFYPWSDALLYSDMRSDTVRFLQPTFTDRLGDVQIYHASRYLPPALEKSMSLRALWVHQVPTQLSDWALISERDGTESWRFHREDGKRGLPKTAP